MSNGAKFKPGKTKSYIQMCFFFLPLIDQGCDIIVYRGFLNNSFYCLCCMVLLVARFLRWIHTDDYYLEYA
jgi:hypothetical protein